MRLGKTRQFGVSLDDRMQDQIMYMMREKRTKEVTLVGVRFVWICNVRLMQQPDK